MSVLRALYDFAALEVRAVHLGDMVAVAILQLVSDFRSITKCDEFVNIFVDPLCLLVQVVSSYFDRHYMWCLEAGVASKK